MPDVHAGRGRRSKSGVPVLAGLIILLLGAGLALWLQPVPHSDWGYYWEAAGRYRDYERGGVGLWLLAIPKWFGLSPTISALWLNLPAAMAVLWVSWRADENGRRGLWLATAAYLALVAPFFGLVQLDLVATAALGTAAWLAVGDGPRRRGRVVAATMLVVVAVSTRPQFALTLWTMLALAGVPWALRRHSAGVGMRGLLGVLLAGSILGFGLDYGLRELGDRGGSIRTSSAVTLYAGLLASSDEPAVCGRWSLDATQAARKDSGKPLHQAVADRLSGRPASHWLSILRCKVPGIVLAEPYALDWLANAPNVREARDGSPRHETLQTQYFRALRLERLLYHIVALSILGIAAATTLLLAWRRQITAVIPFAWVASFWLVHLVFEIQGRYFLGMYLLAPLVCMLALSMTAATGRGWHGGAVSAQRAG